MNNTDSQNTNDLLIKSINDLYALLAKNNQLNQLNEASQWLNLGYWNGVNTINEACSELIKLVVKFASINDGETILDVGFGYGVQDILISTLLPNSKIYGINILENQVNFAQQLVEQNKLSDKIFLTKGDATNLPYFNFSFDNIISIESAFHFNTRADFFKQAHKVLKVGGKICLVDFVTSNEIKIQNSFELRCQKLGIPLSNQCTFEEYKDSLIKIGFENIEFIDISQYVIPYAATLVKHQNGWRNNEPMVLPNEDQLSVLIKQFKINTTIDKYFVIKATKR